MVTLGEFSAKKEKICIVGLGYVGMPLAAVMNRAFDVIGFDINQSRVAELNTGHDRTHEVSSDDLKLCSIRYTSDPKSIREAALVIVTVPTPVDEYKIPDLTPVISATRTVGRNLRPGAIVVYESTVYPGVTEDECIPILEQESGLKHLVDFHVGYSPERVNPGDREHTVDRIKKVVSGDSPEITDLLAEVYGRVITAGVHKAPTIKTAEAAKVIENTQRDLNIALMNELSLIFNKMKIDTRAVLDAAGTKWNFLKFEPGLVGGHCIGVDPYYLTFKAESIGYRPEVILAGRRINDSMGKYVAENTVKKLIGAGRAVKGSKVLIMGLTFKENINDIRNTRIIDIFNELRSYHVEAFIMDPHADPIEVKSEYGIELIGDCRFKAPYDAVVLAVKHSRIIEQYNLDRIKALCYAESPILIDIKGVFDQNEAASKRMIYWRL